MIKRDLRQVPRSDLAGLSQYGSTPLRDVVALHPFELVPEDGETLPRPDRDPGDGKTILVGRADALYLLDHPAPITLGTPAMEDGEYAGQRIRLSARYAQITLPAGPTLRGGPVTVVPGQDAELTWDPVGQWAVSGVGAGGGPATVASVFGRLGAVVAQAGDYTPAQVGADPAGTAAAAVVTHVSQPDPHTQYLAKAGGTMTGTLAMSGQAISGAGAVTATSYNAVPLTALGTADTWLDGTGAYTTPSAATVGADPAGAASSAVSAHEAAPDPHTQYLLKAGDTMSGTLAMGGQAISGAGAVTASSFNGAAITTLGSPATWLSGLGTYTTPTAGQVGADPAGAATSAVSAHEAAPDPHTQYLLKSGGTMSGTLAMGGQAISGAGAVTASSFNGVALTTAGAATAFLNAAGLYAVPAGGGGSVFGENYSFSAKNTPLATTSATLTSYQLHTTPALNPGNYVINITLVITGSAASSQLRVELLVDGISYGGPRVETGIAGGVYVFSGSVWAFWPGGVRTVEMQVALAGGAGTATALAATTHVWRGS